MIFFNRLLLSVLVLYLLLFVSPVLLAKEVATILPIPKEMTFAEGTFDFDASTQIVLPEDAGEHDLFLARLLMAELGDRYLMPLSLQRRAKVAADAKGVIMGSLDNALIRQYITSQGLEKELSQLGDEGYILQVTGKGIFISGQTERGAFYGFQSLRQLLQKRDNKISVPRLEIKDKPMLPFRGIRLYIPGPENIPFFKRFVGDFMALYKFNKVILEVNGVMRLDRHPEINVGALEFAREMHYSRRSRPAGPGEQFQNSAHHDAGDGQILEKAEVAELVNYIRKFHIEVIPEIPSLTHSYYLLNRHRELAEIQEAEWPDTYCPSNPQSYRLTFDVLDEYIEVIKPEIIHLGKDEWRMPVEVCSLCRGKDYRELFVQDIRKIHRHLTDKGIKVAMWGDHFLESVRSKGFRDRKTDTGYTYKIPGAITPAQVKKNIPKDILVFNWFWGDEKNDLAVEQFGFKQVYGNFRPNISNWGTRSRLSSVLGGAPSSWAATTEFNMGKDLLYDFLGCANLLWSEHDTGPQELAQMTRLQMPSIRKNLSGRQHPSSEGNEVVPVAISRYYNALSSCGEALSDFQNLKSGEVSIDEKIFNIATLSEPGENRAVFVCSGSNDQNQPATQVDGIKIDEDASSFIFLQACARPAANEKTHRMIYNFQDTADLLGWYEIVYEDGFVTTIPIRYGLNILEWNINWPEKIDSWEEGRTGAPQHTYCYDADPVDCSQDPAQKPVTFFAFEWKNERFGKKITEINLKGSINYKNYQNKTLEDNAIILLALSMVKARPKPAF